MRNALLMSLVFAAGFAACWVVKGSPRFSLPSSTSAPSTNTPHNTVQTEEGSVVRIDWPESSGRRVQRQFRVLHVKHARQSMQGPVQAPHSDPLRTVVVTFGTYGDPQWLSLVLVEP